MNLLVTSLDGTGRSCVPATLSLCASPAGPRLDGVRAAADLVRVWMCCMDKSSEASSTAGLKHVISNFHIHQHATLIKTPMQLHTTAPALAAVIHTHSPIPDTHNQTEAMPCTR